MFKLLKQNIVEVKLGVKNLPEVNFIKVFLFIIIAFLLSIRDLDIAIDDYNYLRYFHGSINHQVDNIVIRLIEEPLWRFYITIITIPLSPDVAFRFTLFISSLIFMLSASKVNEKLFLFVFILFIIHPDLSTQMYFNQIRQGFALSLFLLISVYYKRPLLAGIIATFIHTSFIFPLFIVLLSLRIRSFKYIAVISVLITISIYFGINFVEKFDLGRRTSTYQFEGKFNINYYIFAIVRYVPIIYLIGFHGNKKGNGFWFKITLSAFLIFIPFTLLHSGAGRLTYYLSVFGLLMVLENYKGLVGKIALLYYFLFVIIELIIVDERVFEHWRLILN